MDDKTYEEAFSYVSQGYQTGYSYPESEPLPPLQEPWLGYYQAGVEAGRKARAEADAQYQGPAIGPDPGGESYEHYQERWRGLFESIFHEHMSHIENEETEIPEPPEILE